MDKLCGTVASNIVSAGASGAKPAAFFSAERCSLLVKRVDHTMAAPSIRRRHAGVAPGAIVRAESIITQRMRGLARLLCGLGLALGIVSTASADVETTKRNEAIYQYSGPDRDQRLVERAKQEGVVVIYTSLAPTESQPLAQAFEKKYRVKVELWRALSDKVVQRAVTEAQGRRFAVDVVETNGPEMEMLAREKLLAEFHSPYLADLPSAAIPPHRTWF